MACDVAFCLSVSIWLIQRTVLCVGFLFYTGTHPPIPGKGLVSQPVVWTLQVFVS